MTEEGTFYYVMELLEGLDADRLVREHEPLPPERAVYLLQQTCKSLEEAHAQGLIHRDVKPANIYVCRYGLEYDFVKVLDFGLVKGGGPLTGESGLTAAGAVAGTAHYIAPEMARADDQVNQRADLYALGCVAYFLLTGRTVFEGATPMDVLIEHVKTRPVPPSQKSGLPIPRALEQIVMDCLEKDPENRPQTRPPPRCPRARAGLDTRAGRRVVARPSGGARGLGQCSVVESERRARRLLSGRLVSIGMAAGPHRKFSPS